MVPGTVVIELFLAVMLTVAGVSKLIDNAGFKQSLREFHVPGPIIRPASFALPIVEVMTALGLLLPVAVLGSLTACLILLGIFTVAITVCLLRGHRPACRCFGQASDEPIGVRTLVRNVLLEGQEEIAGRFGVDIVPAMLFIGRDNRIESLAAHGEDAVRALWWRQLVAANSRDLQATRLHAVLARAAAQ